jgi:hypothetical protein
MVINILISIKFKFKTTINHREELELISNIMVQINHLSLDQNRRSILIDDINQ